MFYNSSQAALISELFNFIARKVRPITDRLITQVTDEKIFGKPARNNTTEQDSIGGLVS